MLAKEFPETSQKQALDISLALEKILKGQQSLLERMERGEQRAAEQIQELRARADKMDELTEKWNTDQEKFIADTYAQADRLKVTGDAKEKMIGKFSTDFQQAVIEARAEIVTENLRFEDELKHMPTEIVTSPGIVEIVVEQGGAVQKLMPEVIRIKRRVWVLPPGRPIEVPTIVAQRLREKRLSEQETAERKAAMEKQGEAGILVNEWNRINSKYHSKTDVMRPQ